MKPSRAAALVLVLVAALVLALAPVTEEASPCDPYPMGVYCEQGVDAGLYGEDMKPCCAFISPGYIDCLCAISERIPTGHVLCPDISCPSPP